MLHPLLLLICLVDDQAPPSSSYSVSKSIAIDLIWRKRYRQTVHRRSLQSPSISIFRYHLPVPNMHRTRARARSYNAINESMGRMIPAQR